MKKQLTLFIQISVTMVFLASCAKENQSAQPVQINLQMGAYTTAQNKLWSLFVPKANASVASLKMCFKRLRFKLAESSDDSSSSPSGSDDLAPHNSGNDDSSSHNSKSADSSTGEDNIDFNIGEVTVSSQATHLGSIKIPAGVYRRIEFDLESSCAGGKSLSLVNNQGSFSTTDRITIRFEGRFSAELDGTLTLGVQQILTQLNSYNGTGTIKSATESISGVLSN